MRKEIIIAIIGGIIIGVLVAFGSWRANLALNVKDTINSTKESANTKITNPQPSTEPKDSNFSISLTGVTDLEVLTDAKLNLTGITKPNTLVAISGESEDYIIKSSSNGSFEQDINLNSGPNQILFTAFSPNGEKIEKKLTVVYSMEFGNISSN